MRIYYFPFLILKPYVIVLIFSVPLALNIVRNAERILTLTLTILWEYQTESYYERIHAFNTRIMKTNGIEILVDTVTMYPGCHTYIIL